MKFQIFQTAILLLILSVPSVFAAPQNLTRDTWYVMTLNGSIHYGYYNEKIELKQDRLYFQSRVWKQEEDYINEEQLGAFAQNDSALTPLFFNFHSNYRTTETNVDGTVLDGKLSVKIRKGNAEPAVLKRGIAKNTIFAQFFPLWILRHLDEIKTGKGPSFRAVIEDNLDLGFAPIAGRVRLEKNELVGKLPGTIQLAVTFQDLPSKWWIDESGIPVRIEMTKSHVIAEKVSKEKALSFLK